MGPFKNIQKLHWRKRSGSMAIDVCSIREVFKNLFTYLLVGYGSPWTHTSYFLYVSVRREMGKSGLEIQGQDPANAFAVDLHLFQTGPCSLDLPQLTQDLCHNQSTPASCLFQCGLGKPWACLRNHRSFYTDDSFLLGNGAVFTAVSCCFALYNSRTWVSLL